MEIALSSCKRGYGLKELVSGLEGEYWNTDDTLPHSVHISFPRLTYVHCIRLVLSYTQDNSYTPETIVVNYGDVCREHRFMQPEGTVELPVAARVFDIFLVIVNNHSEGKDSHVRSLRVMAGPGEEIKLRSEICE